jgi:hypothetical protein
MKKLFLSFALVAIMTISVFAMTGCGKETQEPPAAPTSVLLIDNVLTWRAVDNIEKYFVYAGNNRIAEVDETRYVVPAQFLNSRIAVESVDASGVRSAPSRQAHIIHTVFADPATIATHNVASQDTFNITVPNTIRRVKISGDIAKEYLDSQIIVAPRTSSLVIELENIRAVAPDGEAGQVGRSVIVGQGNTRITAELVLISSGSYNRLVGGRGGNGSTGAAGQHGMAGGAGGSAILATNVTLTGASEIRFIAGNGGNGGNGGTPSIVQPFQPEVPPFEENPGQPEQHEITSGRNGGRGGNGGIAVDASSSFLVTMNSRTLEVKIIVGVAGNGGIASSGTTNGTNGGVGSPGSRYVSLDRHIGTIRDTE